MTQIWNALKGKKTYLVSAVAVGLWMLQQAGIQIPGVTIDGHAIEVAVLAATIRHGVSTDAVKAAAIALIGGSLVLFSGGARATDLNKAQQFSLPSAPCLSTACTGFYAGAFFGGLGNNVNVLGNGINGSFNSGGMMPGGNIGWQYYDGKFMFGLEFDGGYQFASNVAVPGAATSFNGPFGIIQAKFGASLSQLAPSFSIPNLPLTIITPYLAGGEMMQQHGGTGGVAGGGIEFQLGTDSSYFLNVEYLNGGGSGQNGNASASQNNFWLVGVDHLF